MNIEKARAALEAAHSFISGFEDDETQEGIPELLEEISQLLAEPEPTPADPSNPALEALENLRPRWPFLSDPEDETEINGADFLDDITGWWREVAMPAMERHGATKAPDLEIAKMLVLSTAHVTRETAKLLDLGVANDGIGFPKWEYGWFVAIPVDFLTDKDIPRDLKTVMRYATWNGCKWLMFDRDAAKIEDLPTWEW